MPTPTESSCAALGSQQTSSEKVNLPPGVSIDPATGGIGEALPSGISLTGVNSLDGDAPVAHARPGSYLLKETAPSGSVESGEPSGMIGVYKVNDEAPQTVEAKGRPNDAPGSHRAANTYGEWQSASFSRMVYDETTQNRRRELSDLGLSGVTVTIVGTDTLGKSVRRTATTRADGSFLFTDLPAGSYQLVETFSEAPREESDHATGALDLSQLSLGPTSRAGSCLFGKVCTSPARHSRRIYMPAINSAHDYSAINTARMPALQR